MMLNQQSQQGPTLAIIAHGANLLKDIETFGKQDPYLRFTLDFTNPKSFQKTFVHKNAGKNPVWNQSFTVPLNGESNLFIEIMDEEATADAVIAFTAIPVNQVVHAPGGTLNGIFDVYSTDGKPFGEVNLTLTAHNVPGQNSGFGGQAAAPAGPVRAQAHLDEAHQKRMKSIKNKELAADGGLALAGGLFALGAGLLANKVVGDQKRHEQERRESEHQQEVEHEQIESEKKRLENERSTFERTQTEERAKFEREQQEFRTQQVRTTSSHSESSHSERHEEHHHGGEHHKKHGHEHEHKHGGRDWDSVGNYSTGDKVSYQGREYICLQGHQSNPTWEPNQAHSLWRAD